MTLTQCNQVEAHRLGFALVGVTTPLPPQHYDAFEAWLNAGRHASMGYLARSDSRLQRSDPHHILPECRSIIVLGMPYPPSRVEMLSPASPYQGNIASYAWSEDYHLSLPPRLNALVAFIEAQVGETIHHACYTDSGHILERDLAQRAGLGWIGKNTNLINSLLGSHFLLAEILLGVELDVSPPFEKDHCGTCHRCVQACPTGCILPDRTLDASRCISYQTIENKGSIPVELRNKMDGWVFGCDICQQVCPWNKRMTHSVTGENYSPQPVAAHPDLIMALALTPESFSQLFSRSPIKRAKRTGYLRNVAVALGNRLAEFPSHPQRPDAIAALSNALQHDPSALVRGHAAWALGRSGEKGILRQAYCTEKDLSVLEEITIAETL